MKTWFKNKQTNTTILYQFPNSCLFKFNAAHISLTFLLTTPRRLIERLNFFLLVLKSLTTTHPHIYSSCTYSRVTCLIYWFIFLSFLRSGVPMLLFLTQFHRSRLVWPNIIILGAYSIRCQPGLERLKTKLVLNPRHKKRKNWWLSS